MIPEDFVDRRRGMGWRRAPNGGLEYTGRTLERAGRYVEGFVLALIVVGACLGGFALWLMMQ